MMTVKNMQIKNKQDLRVVKTKDAIHTAFKQMICEMDYDKITVRELTERAQIHYKTFYLHYSCIEALLDDLIEKMLEEYYAEIDQIPVDAPFTEINRVFFEFMARQEPYLERLILTPSYQEHANRRLMRMITHNRQRYNPYAAYSVEEQHIINTYLCINSLNLCRQWISDGKKIPLERMIELSGILLSSGINAIRS